MDFELNAEQLLLRDTTREILSRAYDFEKRNAIAATGRGWSTDLWQQLAQVGLLGLVFDETDDGMGAGPVEVMSVMTEVGRHLTLEPILDGVITPGSLVASLGTPEQRQRLLPSVAQGNKVLAFAHHEPGSRWPDAEVATSATETDGGWMLRGVKNPVLQGGDADTIVVSAVHSNKTIRLFLVEANAPGLQRTRFATHDARRGAQIRLADVIAEPLGVGHDVAAAIQRVEVQAQAALCAEAVGAMDAAMRLTTEYLKQRRQFGVPLASFQALTFRAADMYVLLELARTMSLYATMSLAGGVVDPAVASRTKLQISRSARKLGQEAIQLHGGIGVTDEHPIGHYVSRLTAIEHTLGGADEHLRVLGRRG